ncbi:uncharacterized protein, partial [Penaeus vannamei]|uniref:uncharacterized protein n=1 Tax=Penaeus vannamei TaxID=6689 RepID=UPI00387F997E
MATIEDLARTAQADADEAYEALMLGFQAAERALLPPTLEELEELISRECGDALTWTAALPSLEDLALPAQEPFLSAEELEALPMPYLKQLCLPELPSVYLEDKPAADLPILEELVSPAATAPLPSQENPSSWLTPMGIESFPSLPSLFLPSPSSPPSPFFPLPSPLPSHGPSREELPVRQEAFEKPPQPTRRTDKVAISRDWPTELSAILDSSTESRMLRSDERTVLAEFCDAHHVPLLTIRQITTYLGVGDESLQLVVDASCRTFLRDGKAIKYARNLASFQAFLFEAKHMMAQAASTGCQHLVGVCLELMCLVAQWQQGSTSPPS